MGRSSHARTRSRQPGRWSSQSLKRTIGLVPTSAAAGGRRRLTQSSLRMAVGTIPNPRMQDATQLNRIVRERCMKERMLLGRLLRAVVDAEIIMKGEEQPCPIRVHIGTEVCNLHL